jgi:hypothetical protein
LKLEPRWKYIKKARYQFYLKSPDIVVSIVTGYELDDRGVRVQVSEGSRIFTSRRPNRLGGHSAFYPIGRRGVTIPGGKVAGA